MAFWNRWPYTNLQNLNLDWILNEIKRLKDEGLTLVGIKERLDSLVGSNSETAKNADKLGGVDADDYARKDGSIRNAYYFNELPSARFAMKDGTINNAENLGGKPPEAYRAVNLLDNPDCAIAQAGYGEMHGSIKYAADRWRLTGGGVFTRVDGINRLTTTGIEGIVTQSIDENLYEYGDALTFAIFLDDDRIICCSGIVPTPISGSQQVVATIAFDNTKELYILMRGDGKLDVRVDANTTDTTVSFKHMMLVKGTYTADTLPLYVQPDPVVELAKCQRYYLPQVARSITGCFVGGVFNTFIPTPVTMIEPVETVVKSGDNIGGTFNGNSFTTSVTGGSTIAVHPCGVQVALTVESVPAYLAVGCAVAPTIDFVSVF